MKILKIAIAALWLAMPAASMAQSPSPTYEAAMNGDAGAQYKLSGDYRYGFDGVPKDPQKSLYWMEQAAQNGHKEAQYSLSLKYATGKETPKDNEKSILWLTKAAQGGHVGAQLSLGDKYRNGFMVSEDYSKAMFWYAKAAEQNEPRAYREIGSLYNYGYGVEKDRDRAWVMIRKYVDLYFAGDRAAHSRLLRHECALFLYPDRYVLDLDKRTKASSSRCDDPAWRPSQHAEPDLASALAAGFIIAAILSSNNANDDTEPSPHSPYVQKAINECRNEVHRRMVRCYSSMTIPGCTLAGECTYEWTCQSGNKGRGKCRPNSRYTDERLDYYCDPLVGNKYTTKEPVYAESCH